MVSRSARPHESISTVFLLRLVLFSRSALASACCAERYHAAKLTRRFCIQVNAVPEAQADGKTGISRVVGCGVWDSSRAEPGWNSGTVSTTVAVKEANAYLYCSTTHTSTFAPVEMDAGCDGGVVSPLKTNNKCGVCEPIEAPMQGKCDWEGLPCDHDKNACGVCHVDAVTQTPMRKYTGAPKGSTTAEHLEMRNESGICDYLGNPCPNPSAQEVSVCGLCVNRADNVKTLTVQNEGICDCKDSGIPNGGAIVDCCGQCEGGNANLDYCGFIAGICFDGGTPPANVPCPQGADKCPVPRSIPNHLVSGFIQNTSNIHFLKVKYCCISNLSNALIQPLLTRRTHEHSRRYATLATQKR